MNSEKVTARGQDLRSWIAAMQEAGELVTVKGADRESEIGGVVDIAMRKMGRPSVLFEDIPGYPDTRVLGNLFTSVKRIALTVGLPADTKEVDLVRFWRDYMRHAPTLPTKEVNSGALLDNTYTGDDIDIMKIPAPRWHEQDGGHYIGTGCMVIMRDRDSGWVNFGAYRIQQHDKRTASVMISKGKHGDILMKPLPRSRQAMPDRGRHRRTPQSVGPSLGLEIPYGKNEFDAAGGLHRTRRSASSRGPQTGLPIPAEAEIAFEGFVHQGRPHRWKARSASGQATMPAARRMRPADPDVQTFWHRDNPDADRRGSRHSAQRRHVLSRHRSCRRRSGRNWKQLASPSVQGRLVATKQAAAACG